MNHFTALTMPEPISPRTSRTAPAKRVPKRLPKYRSGSIASVSSISLLIGFLDGGYESFVFFSIKNTGVECSLDCGRPLMDDPPTRYAIGDDECGSAEVNPREEVVILDSHWQERVVENGDEDESVPPTDPGFFVSADSPKDSGSTGPKMENREKVGRQWIPEAPPSIHHGDYQAEQNSRVRETKDHG